MASLTLTIPDDLLRDAKARLVDNGSGDIEDYLLCSLEALTMRNKPIDKDTEKKLLEGLASPLVEMTEKDWTALHARVGRHQRP